MTPLITHNLPYKKDTAFYFELIRTLAYPVFIDSGRNKYEFARFDIISAVPAISIKDNNGIYYSIEHETNSIRPHVASDIFDIAKQELENYKFESASDLPFVGGFIGHLSYDHGCTLQGVISNKSNNPQLAASEAGLYHWAIVTDHKECKTTLLFNQFCSKKTQKKILRQIQCVTPNTNTPQEFKVTTTFKSNLDLKEYKNRFDKIKQYLLNGDVYQVNLTQRFRAKFQGSPWEAYKKLRKANPSPYSAFLDYGNYQILSLSPEQFLQVNDGVAITKPIKGTRPRSSNPELDEKLRQELLESPKDQAENLMIVDLLRNDLGKVCEIGSVKTTNLFEIESYTSIHHLVSTITARLPIKVLPIDLIKSAFPGGSITGAPKIRAMQIIEELEPHQRGPYCGSVFYLSLHGRIDSSIAIRTLVCERDNIYCWGGGGIVADSVCEDEYQESITKIKNLMISLEEMRSI